jgi:capsular polysaccharide export protein
MSSPGALPDEPAGAVAPRWDTVATFSRGTARIPHLANLLGARRVVLSPGDGEARGIDAVVAWGDKPSGVPAAAYARRHGLPLWRAEDGFLRSVGLGVDGAPPLSLVLDDLGVYYDARSRSRLEATLAGDTAWLDDPAVLARARAAIDRIVAARLSKYNGAPVGGVDLGPRRRRVLVVDQTAGDLSISRGLASEATFTAMLAAARAEHPGAEVVVKTHPDVLAGKKRGCLPAEAGPGVRVVATPCAPLELIAQVDHVYVVTSQVGLEALLAGTPVTCFGAPFYAGWGLTDDRVTLPRRGRRRTVEQLFAAAYLGYARYVDPATGAPCALERVIDHLALQRAQFARNHGDTVCFGFRLWKHNYVRAYLRSPGSRVRFARDAGHAARLGFGPGSRALVWGQRETAAVRALAARHGVDVWRMEDGFLRSVGLGSDLAMPASLVVDRRGIYYDPRGASDLEVLLQDGEFTAEEQARARALRERLVGAGVSKYNVGASRRLPVPPGRRVVLVPGQVEDDASVRLGGGAVRGNQALLEAARAAAPGAFVVYKPHPDVVSGNRAGALARAAALRVCDHLEEDAALADCLAVADEVHTMTSLVGFEALLRGLRVVVYGTPFYAGWGLTEDRDLLPAAAARRTRRRTLDELVAAAMLRYPLYLDRRTGEFTTAEAVLEELVRERDAAASGRALRMSWPRRQLRKLGHVYRGLVHAP